MGSVMDEFEFIAEEIVEDNSTFEDDSNELVVKAENFIDSASKYPDKTYQGIPIKQYIQCISIGETEIVSWNHVKWTMNVNKLKDLDDNKLEEFVVPSFVEELDGIGNKEGAEFGFNQSGRNKLRYIYIPENVIVIAPYTFAFYKKLENIEFSDNSKLIYLGAYTFVGCDKLHTVDLRKCKELDEIKDGTFDNSAVKVLKISSNIKKMCSLDKTNIETVYVDNNIYSAEEFNDLIKDAEEKETETVGYDF